MPSSSDLSSVLDRQLLGQLGGRLKGLRQKQGLSQTALAQTVGISRTTLTAVEAGDPAPTMGTYVRVMSALGVAGDLALLASGALQSPLPGRAGKRAQPLNVVVSAGDAQHEIQDLQSLMMHKESVKLLQRQPELVQQALSTLEKWRSAGDSHAQVLWDEWAVILRRKEWRKALAMTRRAKELRQASPLPTLLPAEVRQSILQQVRSLKKGVVLGNTLSSPAPVEGPAA